MHINLSEHVNTGVEIRQEPTMYLHCTCVSSVCGTQVVHSGQVHVLK